METRNDILVYTTEPLAEGVEVSGFIETTLYVSSDVKDTDFTIKLIDVYPDGKAYNLDETIQRVRYREGSGRGGLDKCSSFHGRKGNSGKLYSLIGCFKFYIF